jgi:5-methylcytosine-specific restriction endonuclease McrA
MRQKEENQRQRDNEKDRQRQSGSVIAESNAEIYSWRETQSRKIPDKPPEIGISGKGHRPDFYKSPGWKKARHDALKASEGRCDLCGRPASKKVRLHVDHIKPRSKRPDLALDINNLQVLCQDCNLGKGNRDSTDWRRRE